jgi:hypothetical protein
VPGFSLSKSVSIPTSAFSPLDSVPCGPEPELVYLFRKLPTFGYFEYMNLIDFELKPKIRLNISIV